MRLDAAPSGSDTIGRAAQSPLLSIVMATNS
jgi:hypothetical protein